MIRKALLKPLFALAIAAMALAGPASAEPGKKLTVFKHPMCGCCGKWVEHMRDAGFEVVVSNTENMTMIKKMAGIPEPLESCHTATIDGYRIEGHVPADDVKRLLDERPDVAGLAVAGMPLGSPGMEVETGEVEAYDVHAFKTNGSTSVFASHD